MDREKARRTVDEIDALERKICELKDDAVGLITGILEELPGREYRVKGVPAASETPSPMDSLGCFLEDNCPYVEYRDGGTTGRSRFGYVTRVFVDESGTRVDGFEEYPGDKAWLVGDVRLSRDICDLENPETVLGFLLEMTKGAE